MKCPRCGSSNMHVQAVNKARLVKKRRSIFHWLFIGWWLWPLLWFFFTLPMLLVKLFAPKRQRIKNKLVSLAVCQDCGFQKELG